jgi:hypothetical protein
MGNEHWMTRDMHLIRRKPLNEVAIPGSHDAGTSGMHTGSPWTPGRREWWVPLARAFKCVTVRYSKTQTLSVLEQARLGVRYFDLRAAPYNDPELGRRTYRFTHGLLGDDFLAGVGDLCQFAMQNPCEILILDIRKLIGFTAEDHSRLITALEAIAGHNLCSDLELTPRSTVDEFLHANQNIIIIYPKPTPRFWSSLMITTKWPNSSSVEECVDFIDEAIERRVGTKADVLLHNVQACVTPNAKSIVQDPLSSTLKLAKRLNKRLLPLVRTWDRLNVIMVDGVGEGGLVDEIIRANQS